MSTPLWKTRLLDLIERNDLTMKSLSLKAGLNETYVRDILKRDRTPSIDKIGALADALGVSATDLLGDTAGASVIPILSWVSASALADFGPQDDVVGHIQVAGLPNGDWIALKVSGDSMDRISPPESIILVDRSDKRLSPNACYVVANKDGEAAYKRYRPNPTRFEPVSTNPSHEPIFPDNDVPVIGRVRLSILAM
jgi:SOS-response transcriptional repressor LexA